MNSLVSGVVDFIFSRKSESHQTEDIPNVEAQLVYMDFNENTTKVAEYTRNPLEMPVYPPPGELTFSPRSPECRKRITQKKDTESE